MVTQVNVCLACPNKTLTVYRVLSYRQLRLSRNNSILWFWEWWLNCTETEIETERNKGATHIHMFHRNVIYHLLNNVLEHCCVYHVSSSWNISITMLLLWGGWTKQLVCQSLHVIVQSLHFCCCCKYNSMEWTMIQDPVTSVPDLQAAEKCIATFENYLRTKKAESNVIQTAVADADQCLKTLQS